MRARRTVKHLGDILEQLKSAVERPAGNHVEGDIGITVVDPVAACAPGDDGKDDHPETLGLLPILLWLVVASFTNC